MNAKDLMVGDLVCCVGTNIRVTSLYDKCDSNEIGWGRLESTWANGSVIEPIPLTAEILVKNGFEKNWQDNYEYFDDDEGLNITFHPKSSNYTNGAYDYIDVEKGCMTINEMPITFVHELQHALILCESKKEIVL
jgi:hypothetical protein